MPVVKNRSEVNTGTFKYHYTNLAGLEDAGHTVPSMRIANPITKEIERRLPDGTVEIVREYDTDVEYIECKVDGEWVRGSRIMEFESGRMNPCQCRGSAETYCRRYSMQMTMGIATDDDDDVEQDQTGKSGKGNIGKLNFDDCKAELDAIATADDVRRWYDATCKKYHASDKQRSALEGFCKARIKKIGESQ